MILVVSTVVAIAAGVGALLVPPPVQVTHPPRIGETGPVAPAPKAPGVLDTLERHGVPEEVVTPGGRLYEVAGVRVLELTGTPEQMGTAHGKLLGPTIRRVIDDVLEPDPADSSYRRIMAGAALMEPFQPEEYRREMASLAEAAGVPYMQVVALQLFGDAQRGYRAGEADSSVTGEDLLKDDEPRDHQCTNFALFGPATAGGELICGRNFDYWHSDVSRYASVLIHYRPEGGRSFVTISWAGVINGWTLMNDAGLVAANNNAYDGTESCEGISTCFLQRLIVQNASTVTRGIAIARKGPRAVTTAMLIAGRDDAGTEGSAGGWNGVELEFDHEDLAVRRAHEGWVIAANGRRRLGLETPIAPEDQATGRYGELLSLVRAGYGRIDRTMNLAAAPGVPLRHINLHCAMLYPGDLTMRIAMGEAPACDGTFALLKMTTDGIVEATE